MKGQMTVNKTVDCLASIPEICPKVANGQVRLIGLSNLDYD